MPLFNKCNCSSTSPSKLAKASDPSRHIEKRGDEFLKALEERRTVYELTNKSSIPDERIVEIVQHSGEFLCTFSPYRYFSKMLTWVSVA